MSASEPKWDLFRGIFRYFHGRMERIFISHFSFSIAEQIQFWTITTHSNAHTCTHTQTDTSTSFADPNEQVKHIPAPSDFLHLFPTDRIPLQVPGFYLTRRQQQTLLYTLQRENPKHIHNAQPFPKLFLKNLITPGY